ncbi:MAG: GDP-mannose 4,6-dehydratase [Nannocystaceae bacterium]
MAEPPRRVLVTGADGFIGSHLVERLLDAGHEVTAVVRASSTVGTSELRLRNLAAVRTRLAGVVALDIASADAVARMAECAPQWVFHLAAEAFVERSFTQPHEVLRTNLGGTMNVLQLARQCRSIERTIVTSSSEVYGTAQHERIDERHPLEPTSPYAASKLAADRMAAAFVHTWALPLVIVRPFNCYGPRHVYDVIPASLRGRSRANRCGSSATAGNRATSPTSTTWSRVSCWRHDTPTRSGARSTSAAVKRYRSPRSRTIVELTDSRSAIEHAPPRAAEVARLCCDATAAHTLGWRASVPLREGLRRNIAWAREHA